MACVAVVKLWSEGGCNPVDGEYCLELSSISADYDFDHLDRIKDAALESIDVSRIKNEVLYTITLIERFEREDVFTNIYFENLSILEEPFQ